MNVGLDIFEMYYLLESCLRGSHLRSRTILRFVDEWYELFTKEQRDKLYYDTLRLVYNNYFSPFASCCGADKIFMARFNPDNQYKITLSNGRETKIVNTFKTNNKYYVKSNRYCAEEYIKKIEKI